MPKFVALARVSSREQEREGFSLDVQEAALRGYAERAGGEIVRFFRIAETASKTDERKTFRELIRYAKKHAGALDGLLFYKVDRAARNLVDYVELEKLESDHGVPFISVSQPTENTPAGRMMRRTLANMASFYTEQQSVDVREGIARRVAEGWFPTAAPYGYRNVRKDGRGVVEVDPEDGPKVSRVFRLFAYEGLTLDTLAERLAEDGVAYRPSSAKWPRSTLHALLRHRAYIGEVPHQGEWHPGRHEPLTDRETWDRVQTLLGSKVYRSHELVYAGGLIACGHCGHAITGERVKKKLKAGETFYVYYRCSKYRSAGHPPVRLREADLDGQVLDLFGKIRIDDPAVRGWFAAVLRAQTADEQEESHKRRADLKRRLTALQGQQDRLLNLRLADEIDADAFAAKRRELRDREAALKLQAEVADRSHAERADLAARAFELSQALAEKWVTADHAEKRAILEILCLNLTLSDATLCYEMRKPFDVLVEGLSPPVSRDDKIRTCGLYVPNVALYQAELHPVSWSSTRRRGGGRGEVLRTAAGVSTSASSLLPPRPASPAKSGGAARPVVPPAVGGTMAGHRRPARGSRRPRPSARVSENRSPCGSPCGPAASSRAPAGCPGCPASRPSFLPPPARSPPLSRCAPWPSARRRPPPSLRNTTRSSTSATKPRPSRTSPPRTVRRSRWAI